jgi:phosphoribosylamine--glycine ligase
MKVLVVGGGGREHAIAWKISNSPLLSGLYCAPGGPGTESIAENISIAADDCQALADWAEKHEIDLTVVGPEAPLAAGIVDLFQARGLRIFGPCKAAAELEASKSFAKEVMVKAGVPTAGAEVFTDHDAALAYVEEQGAPIVIKADGLAAGKGVTVALDLEQARSALKECFVDARFGNSGSRVVIEDFIDGQEASLIGIVDGETVVPLVLSQDYKRLGDGDSGPNTGGMGAISPTPVLSQDTVETLVKDVFQPVIKELNTRGIPFVGFLYAGIIVGADGLPSVLEFNCRLGDPETQVLLPRMESDLLEVLDAAVDGKLSSIEMRWSEKACACVVASSKGYPLKVDDGKTIEGLFPFEQDRFIFQAGTAKNASGAVVSKGGRVLCVSAMADTLEKALEKAYEGIEQITFEGMHFRRDIGRES